MQVLLFNYIDHPPKQWLWQRRSQALLGRRHPTPTTTTVTLKAPRSTPRWSWPFPGCFPDEEDVPVDFDSYGDHQPPMEACQACIAARLDVTQRCPVHGAAKLAKPKPRSGQWLAAMNMHGEICSQSDCVFCEDIDLDAPRPFEEGVRAMLVKLPDVLFKQGIPAACNFCKREWRLLLERHGHLIPPEKRNMYTHMTGPSHVWHFSEHAPIAEICVAIDAIENRENVRRVRDNDVSDAAGSAGLGWNE